MSEDEAKTATKRVRVPNPQGLHARPSSALVRVASEFTASIVIVNTKSGVEVDGKFLLEVMTLVATQGTELEIRAEGSDADAAVAALVDLIATGFGEK